ncbi:MAG: poly(3-hydroxyalkanoate) depolymerase [Rhodocyclaceae bacterium]|nr:poly(3-hydroxyalkanoate) depolymerase [Rhodocyclaceae bacterium]
MSGGSGSEPATEIRMVGVCGRRVRVGSRGGGDGGTPLLIFNGIGAPLELLEPLTAALGRIDTVVFDVPGVGGSPPPLLPYRFWQLANMANRLMHELGHRGGIDVLGVSWGGALAQQFALQYPARCRRLILAATSPGMAMVPGKWSALRNLLGVRPGADGALPGWDAAAVYGGDLRNDPGLLREHAGHIGPPRGRGYLFQLLACWGWTSLPWLPFLHQPTLVLAGAGDPIVPVVNSRLLHSWIRNASLHVIDDGHLFLLTRTAEAAGIIRSFLGDPAPGRAAGGQAPAARR